MKGQIGKLKKLGRALIWTGLGLAVLVFLAACGGQGTSTAAPPTNLTAPTQSSPSTAAPALTATQPTSTQPSSTLSAPSQTVPSQPAASVPACFSPAALTPAVTEGPFFKAGSPEQSSLLTTSRAGTRLTLTGYVLTADCKPIAHALLDFWQADSNGNYDNSGYTLRGHQFTDATGRYQLSTIVPGLYPGRTEHIHVKVQAPNGPVLTTQLFFPGVADNQADGIFDPKLLINVQNAASSLEATFNFVVSTQ